MLLNYTYAERIQVINPKGHSDGDFSVTNSIKTEGEGGVRVKLREEEEEEEEQEQRRFSFQRTSGSGSAPVNRAAPPEPGGTGGGEVTGSWASNVCFCRAAAASTSQTRIRSGLQP
ncbi:hypothetical protein EYF80_036590 [Liparis tanakae]|uniref:Uncharacterized protein n=1 Tax=Liparis tanakae TaxID=230148 RepID=A0A4Z2GI54_9TELE|nr:hypothetical protein EYF80_036590 [Liparis tanakae]